MEKMKIWPLSTLSTIKIYIKTTSREDFMGRQYPASLFYKQEEEEEKSIHIQKSCTSCCLINTRPNSKIKHILHEKTFGKHFRVLGPWYYS